MSDVTIAPQKVVRTGVTPSYTGTMLTTNVYVVRNTGRMILHFLKNALVICNVTIQTPAKVLGINVAEVIVAVPASTGNKMIGPFPPSIFNNGSGDLKFTMDDVDGVTVAAMEI